MLAPANPTRTAMLRNRTNDTEQRTRHKRVHTEWFRLTWSSRTGKTNSSWKSSQQTVSGVGWGVRGLQGVWLGKGTKKQKCSVLWSLPTSQHVYIPNELNIRIKKKTKNITLQHRIRFIILKQKRTFLSLSFFFCFLKITLKKKDFYLFRERVCKCAGAEGEGENLRKLCTQPAAELQPPSTYLQMTTRDEVNSWMFHWLSHAGAPRRAF